MTQSLREEVAPVGARRVAVRAHRRLGPYQPTTPTGARLTTAAERLGGGFGVAETHIRDRRRFLQLNGQGRSAASYGCVTGFSPVGQASPENRPFHSWTDAGTD